MTLPRIYLIASLAWAAALLPGARAEAQLTCTVSVAGACTVGGAASAAINITIQPATRVTMASSTVTIPQPTDASYTAGFGNPGSVAFEVRSNDVWAVSISSSSTTWSFSPPSARSDKPRADLQWSLAPAGPYTDVSATLTSFASGSATNSSIQTLYLRSKYDWALDRPGTYSIAVQVTLTAP